jgi:hypothetical protein
MIRVSQNFNCFLPESFVFRELRFTVRLFVGERNVKMILVVGFGGEHSVFRRKIA